FVDESIVAQFPDIMCSICLCPLFQPVCLDTVVYFPSTHDDSSCLGANSFVLTHLLFEVKKTILCFFDCLTKADGDQVFGASNRTEVSVPSLSCTGCCRCCSAVIDCQSGIPRVFSV